MAGKPFSRQERCPGSGLPAIRPGRRSPCEECHREIAVRRDGTLWEHVRVYTINYPKAIDHYLAVIFDRLGRLLREVGDRVQFTLYGWSGTVDAISDTYDLRCRLRRRDHA